MNVRSLGMLAAAVAVVGLVAMQVGDRSVEAATTETRDAQEANTLEPPSEQLAQAATQPSHAASGPSHAIAYIEPTEGNEASGWVRFEKQSDGVKVTAEISGLSPGEHGFHIHQYGDCSAPDGTSAGGHFNPAGVDHGGPEADTRHIGDLGNITAGEDGTATYERVDAHLAFTGTHSFLGRGVIVHAGQDDLTSQPTGAAGPREGCGVIGVTTAP